MRFGCKRIHFAAERVIPKVPRLDWQTGYGGHEHRHRERGYGGVERYDGRLRLSGR